MLDNSGLDNSAMGVHHEEIVSQDYWIMKQFGFAKGLGIMELAKNNPFLKKPDAI